MTDDLRERIRRTFGDGIPEKVYRTDQTTAERPAYVAPVRPPDLTQPVTLRIPWSCLVSDNQKLRAAKRGETPTVLLTPQYREAKQRIRALCVDAMAGRRAMAQPLALEARVWVPDRHRRDVVNFSKALHDALTGTVFQDDSWLHDVRWIRAGVDVDAPRCEVRITPLRTDPV